MKVCSKCKQEKELQYFGKCSKSSDKLKAACKICRQKASKEYRKKNKDKVLQYSREKYQRDKEAHLRRCVDWQSRNKEAVKQHRATYTRKHMAKRLADNAKRRASKLNATPAWAELNKIKGLYKLSSYLSKQYNTSIHVDHIVPLNSPLVCGLHVFDNLQLLYSTDNITKSNDWEV